MKDKIIYIGLTEDPELTPIKNSYLKNKSGFIERYTMGRYISYHDKTYYDRQFRIEEWERVERNTYRITSIVAIKNHLEEGERISLIWD